MKGMSKGHGPKSKGGGMRSHLPASPENNPTKSRSCDTGFGGKSSSHLSQTKGKQGNKFKADNATK